MDPQLSQDYFGNSIHSVEGVATAGELLEESWVGGMAATTPGRG